MHTMTQIPSSREAIEQLRQKILARYVGWQVVSNQDGVEWLKKFPTIPYADDRTINEIVVGIKDGCEVVSIGKCWEDAHGRKGVAQHFFNAGQITGFNYGRISGPGDVLNREPEIDERLRPHYEELKTLQ